MTSNIFRTTGTFLVFAEDSAWGTAGTPTGSTYVDRVMSFTPSLENNPIITQGMGDGPNIKKIVNGGFDVNGGMSWLLTDPSFLEYCFAGHKVGDGTVASPYIIAESDNLGYGGVTSEVPSVTLKKVSDGGTADVMTYDGCFFESCTISGTQGEDNPISVDASWIGRNVVRSTASLVYTSPTNRAFNWIDSKVTVGGDTVGECSSFSLSITNEFAKRRELGNRFLLQPSIIRRRYAITLTLRLRENFATKILSGVEMRGLVFTGSTASFGTSASVGAENTLQSCVIQLSEGSASGDRVVNFNFEDCYFQNESEPFELDNGDVEMTVTIIPTRGLSGVPVSWYTVV